MAIETPGAVAAVKLKRVEGAGGRKNFSQISDLVFKEITVRFNVAGNTPYQSFNLD